MEKYTKKFEKSNLMEIEEVMQKNLIPIITIKLKYLEEVMTQHPTAVVVNILPPSYEVLCDRIDSSISLTTEKKSKKKVKAKEHINSTINV